ncbi:MAG: cytidylate kinase-like family protein [Magnetococcales bacterium]|nr:cytidylate kinase-like family protein [Magnetococcales bacterium]
MTNTPLHLVQAILDAGRYEPETHTEAPAMPKPLVTISRYYGAAGSNTSKLLAERLGVHLYDKELLTTIVNKTKGDKELLARLDEHVRGLVDEMLISFFSKKSITADQYYRYMAKVILGIAPLGGVIVGRAAHLLLSPTKAFRVRLEGSLATCAQRLAKIKNIKPDKAEKLILETNKERDQFERQVAKRFPGAHHGFDITVNTDRFSPEQAVQVIIAAMREAGFQTPVQPA